MKNLDTKKGPCKPAGPFLVTVHCFEIQIIRSIKFDHFMHIIFDFFNKIKKFRLQGRFASRDADTV